MKTGVARRHAVGLVRAEAEAMGLGWVCERELREGLGGRPLHLPDGVVLSTDSSGRQWRTAVEVELTRKTEARVSAILRQLLKTYEPPLCGERITGISVRPPPWDDGVPEGR